jgi:hypothetical protein
MPPVMAPLSKEAEALELSAQSVESRRSSNTSLHWPVPSLARAVFTGYA